MKEKKVKSIQVLIITIFLIIQTIIYVCVGINKSYIHIDEAYSYGLANYERINIQDNESIINIVKKAFNFTSCEHLKRLTSCDVYYIN